MRRAAPSRRMALAPRRTHARRWRASRARRRAILPARCGMAGRGGRVVAAHPHTPAIISPDCGSLQQAEMILRVVLTPPAVPPRGSQLARRFSRGASRWGVHTVVTLCHTPVRPRPDAAIRPIRPLAPRAKSTTAGGSRQSTVGAHGNGLKLRKPAADSVGTSVHSDHAPALQCRDGASRRLCKVAIQRAFSPRRRFG